MLLLLIIAELFFLPVHNHFVFIIKREAPGYIYKDGWALQAVEALFSKL
jgi:hypothetical protein